MTPLAYDLGSKNHRGSASAAHFEALKMVGSNKAGAKSSYLLSNDIPLSTHDMNPLPNKSAFCQEHFAIAGLCLIVLAALYRYLVYPIVHGPLSHVPGPWLNKVTGLGMAYDELRYARNETILKWHTRYGPVVCVSPNMVSVATLEATRSIYRASQGWSKSDYFDNFTGYSHRSVFATKSYRDHREQRKLISGFYQPSSVYNHQELELYIEERCNAFRHHIDQSLTVDVYALTNWFALDIVTYLTLGPSCETHCLDEPCVERSIVDGLLYMQFLGPLRVLIPRCFSYLAPAVSKLWPGLRYFAAEDELADWCLTRVSAAETSPLLHSTDSLLRRLLQHQDNGTSSLDKARVAAEILDNINAARATVAVTATYLAWLLSMHPRIQQRLHDELRTLSASGGFTFAAIDAAPFLDACLRETYRLYPASSGRAERVVPPGGATVEDVSLPEGCIVSNSVVALHMDPSLFPDPKVFDPTRWLEKNTTLLKAREAHLLPFGYGGRACLGKALATMEIKMLAAALYMHYESRPGEGVDASAMRQLSTHDAVPASTTCHIRFKALAAD